MSDEDVRAELDRLRAENEALKSKETRELRLQVSQKKAVYPDLHESWKTSRDQDRV